MKHVATLLSILLLIVVASATVFAQPGAISTNNLVGASTYDCTALTDLGSLRQARILSGTSSSSVSWEFPANCGFPGDVWRPYSAGSVAISFDAVVAPDGGSNIGALYNGSNGGSSGTLASTTSGNYYTFNIEDVSAPTNAYFSVLQTSFNPVTISSVTQLPVSPAANEATVVTITTSSAPSSGENVFVRYTTDGWTTSTLVQATFVGTTGTAVIPCNGSASVAYAYYVYSSNKSAGSINSDATTHGQRAHDLATLNLNNNGGSNYTYTTGAASTNFSGTYYVPSTCYPTITSFVTALNAGTASGPIVVLVAAGHTESGTASINLTATGTVTNTITFQKSGTGANPVVTRTDAGSNATSTLGGLGDAVIQLSGSDYVTFDGIDVAASQSGIEYGYLTHKPSGTDGCQNVTIKNATVTMTKGTSGYVIGIYVGNGTTSVSSSVGVTVTSDAGRNMNFTLLGNTISNVHAGIYCKGSSAMYDSIFTIGQSGAGNTIQNFGGGNVSTTYGVYFIYVSNTSVAYNTINNAGGGGSAHGSTLYGIFYSTAIRGTVVGSNNSITMANSSASSTTQYIYNANTVTSEDYSNNTFAMGTLSSTGSVYLIYASNSTTSKTISGNTTSGTLSRTGASGTFYCYYNNGSPTGTETFSGNNFSNITLAGTSTFYGSSSTTASGHTQNFYNNTISSISGGSGTMYGLHFTTAGTRSVYNNQIYGFTGGGTINGISSGSATTAANIYKNSIYNLASTSTGTTAGTVAGMLISSGTNVYVYNNYISDLKATTCAATDAIRAFNITSTTTTATIGLYYNTVYLNATSSGTNFGTSGVFHTTSTTATTAALDMRNNIIVNNSTPNGTGVTVAYRRSSTTLTNYSNNSNNNDFYGGTADATHLIFYDGTNSDQTIAAYKTRMATRDQSSFSENPPFVNVSTTPYDLHMQTGIATQTESGGTAVTSPIAVADDYDANARNGSTPDVGADEFTGVASDMSAPGIVYTALGNTSSTSNRSFTDVAITDASGVNTTSGTRPRTYYKKSTNANAWNDNTNGTDGWKWVEANGTSTPFDFTLDYAKLFGGAGVTAGDTMQYFVVAQDLAGTPNVGINSGSFAGNPSSVDLTGAAFPLTGTINSYRVLGTISGTKTVGASGADYTTLTDAIAALNNAELNGALTILINADYANTGETFPITIEANSGSSATNTISIKPAGSTTPSFSGSSASSIIKINGADYVTIDGSNTALSPNGTDKSLTISNTSTATSTAAIWVVSLGTGAGSTNVTIKNCNISAGSNSVISTFGIFAGGTSISTSGTGDDNDNLTINNNTITKAYYGVYARASATGMNNSLMITQNTIGSGTATDYVTYRGVDITNTPSATVAQNEIFNLQLSTSVSNSGIELGTGVTDASISRNSIHGLRSLSTSGYGTYGINISSTTTSGISIENNFIYDLITDGDGTSTTFNPFGIRITGGTNHKVYYNSVNLTGSFQNVTTADYCAALMVTSSSATGLDIRNNIFSNSMTGGAGTKAFAIYAATGTTFGTINYNDYYASGANGILGYLGADKTTLGDWQTATTQDVNSLNADPQFTGSTNLHINTAFVSPVSNTATSIGTVTMDYDGDGRHASTPDIGADEFSYPIPQAFTLTSPSGTGQNLSGNLTWASSTGALNYNVYLDQNATPTTLHEANVSGTTSAYTGLTQNTTYYWDVWAKNAVGDSTKASNGPFSFTTVTPPADPTDLMLSDVKVDSMVLSFTDNAPDGGSTETGFIVYRKAGSAPTVGTGSPDSAAILGVNAGTGTANYQDYGLLPNVNYFYRVASRNAQGESNYTENDTTTLAQKPGSPVLTPSGHSIRVVLTPLANSAATEFVITINDTAYVTTTGTTSTTPVWATYAAFGGATGVNVTGLNQGALYRFNSKARNANGIETAYGTLASTTTLGPLPAGDYTIGLTMFNSIAGKEITFRKETRKITVTVDELVTEETKTSPAIYKQIEKEVELDYYVPMENGKVFEGELFARDPMTPNAGVYATITAAIADLNDRGIEGAVRFLLLDATYPTETFPITINNLAGSSAVNTITIKPSSGVMPTITGVSTTSIFKLAGADYVTFDGSNTDGGTSLDMTISNTGTGSSTAAMWLASQGVGAGCSNVTIKNCNISAGSNTVTSTFGIHAGGTSISTSGTGNDNDNLTITNNSITKAYFGIYARATSSGVNDALMITQNSIGSGTMSDQIGKYGIDANQTTGSDISRNTIFNFIAAISNPTGMLLGSGFTNSTVTRNDIHSLKYTGTSGYGGKGIDINTGSGSSNVTIANNMIYDLSGDGWSSFSSDAIVGVRILGSTGGLNIYHNSVNLTGSISRASATVDKSAALYVVSTATNLDVRNNLFANSIENTTGVATAYAMYSDAANTAYSSINYNGYYATGAEGVLGYLGANKTTIGDWRTATGQDAASFDTDPLFTSSTNLHINNSAGMFSPAGNSAVAIGSVTTDIDGDARSSTPDIGADEFVSPAPETFTILAPTGASQPVVVVMNWNRAVGATRYDVYAGTDNPPTTLVANNVADTQYTFSGLPNTTYFWNVYAETPDSGSSRTISSNGPLSFTTVDAPNAPSGLTLTTGLNVVGAQIKSRLNELNQQLEQAKTKEDYFAIEKEIGRLQGELLTSAFIQASWTDNATNEDSFFVYRKAGSAPSIGAPYTDRVAALGSALGAGGNVIFNDTPLDLNTHYYYRVTAVNATGDESGFAGADTTTLAETPGAPTFGNVTWESFTLYLDPKANSAATEFAIMDSASGMYVSAAGLINSATPVWQTYTAWGGAAGKEITGLARGTWYALSSKARNGAGIETSFGPNGRQQTTFDQNGTALNEGFENPPFPPTGWQAVQNDAGAQNWRDTTVNVHGGSRTAHVRYETSVQNDDWLITKLVAVPTIAPELSFWYRAQSTSFVDSFEVWVNVQADGSTPADFLTKGTRIYNNTNNNFTTYQYQSNNMSAYTGQNIYIAWRYKGNDQFRLYLDDVMLTGKNPPNTVTIKKQIDADGDFGTTGDRTAKVWGLSLRTGSPTGTVVASVASDTMLVVPNLLDGTYYAVEEDSAGWAHLGYVVDATPTASSANYVEFTMTGGGLSKEITFVNFQPNTVIVRKYADADGSVGTTDDRSKKSWFLALYRGSVSEGNLVTSGNTDSLFAEGLSSGTYIAFEADSSGWAVLGHVNNGTPTSNTSRYDTISISGGSTTTVDFVNAQLNSITVNKYRDANSGLLSKDEARTWFLAVRSGSCSGTIVASGNSTSVTATGLPAGTYYVSEADSAGWQHSGYFLDNVEMYEQVNCVTVTVGGGQSRTVDFINWHPNTVTVRKFRDADGGTPSFDTQFPWGLSVKDGENDIRGETESGVLVVTDLIDGTYSACEADSEFWSALGYRIDNGTAVTSSAQCVSFSVADGQSITIDFTNFLLDTMKFYSVVADSFALVKDSKAAMKSIKKKADKVEFEFFVKADSNNVNDLHLEFGVELDTVRYDFTVTPTPATMTPVAKSKLKKWDMTFSPALNAGDTVRVSGWGLKGSVQKVSSYWWTRNGVLVGKKLKSPTFTKNYLRLPMPNVHNLAEEIFAQGAFTTTVGMLVGVPRLDAPKEYGWAIHKKYSDVQKSLVKKVKTNYLIHDSTARCFDFFKNGKFLVGKQTSLPPDKYDNKLFAEAIALKLNIAASALSKTTIGYGELKYSDGGHPLNGKMVKEISAYVDSLLTLCQTIGGLTPVGFDSVVSKINSAFAGDFDTLTWSSKLVMKPAVRLNDRTFLVRDPSIVPATIVPLVNEIAQKPEKYELYQNYPNPFNPSTMISFDLPEASKVTLKIYNLLGQEVLTVFDNVDFEDGAQEVEFNATQLSTGVYFYRISATSLDEESGASYSETKKLMLVK